VDRKTVYFSQCIKINAMPAHTLALKAAEIASQEIATRGSPTSLSPSSSSNPEGRKSVCCKLETEAHRES